MLSRLDYQPLSRKWARPPLPNRRRVSSRRGRRERRKSSIDEISPKENFYLREERGKSWVSEWRIRFILLARGFSYIIRVLIDLITCLLMFVHYLTGLTAFDFISDFEEWQLNAVTLRNVFLLKYVLKSHIFSLFFSFSFLDLFFRVTIVLELDCLFFSFLALFVQNTHAWKVKANKIRILFKSFVS